MHLNKLLTILDKPKHGQTALATALELQRATKAHVDLVGFLWHAMAEAEDVFGVDQRRRVRTALVEQQKDLQRELLRDAGGAAADTTQQTVWTDDIAGWVAEAVSTGGHDLVVKSIHQSQTLLHTPLDWQLLRTSPAPVLLSSSRTRSNGCVLAALDLRNPDVLHQQLNEEVLAAAQHFAELYGADMRCVSVLEVSKVLTDLDWVDKYATEKKLAATYKEHAEPLLARFDIDPDSLELVSGKVGAAVNQTAHRRNARLLVVGRCAQPLRQALKLGNSAERILSRAQCDVLAVGPYGK